MSRTTNVRAIGSRSPAFGGLIRWVVGSVVFVLAAVLLVGRFTDLLPPLDNPFRENTVDRTGPSVLYSLTDLSEFHAASAYYETVVSIEKDTSYLPDWVSGEEVLYVGKGSVDAIADFGDLDERRVVVSEDGTSVTITLPAPTVGEPVLDLEGSYVADHDEGLTNSFKGSDLEREAQLKAVEQMTAAAIEEGTLIDLAKENTIAMLGGLLGTLGFKAADITITYDEDPRL